MWRERRSRREGEVWCGSVNLPPPPTRSFMFTHSCMYAFIDSDIHMCMLTPPQTHTQSLSSSVSLPVTNEVLAHTNLTPNYIFCGAINVAVEEDEEEKGVEEMRKI